MLDFIAMQMSRMINREKGHKTMIVFTDLFLFIFCRLPISFIASCQNQGEAKRTEIVTKWNVTDVYSRGRKRNKLIFTSSESTLKQLRQKLSCSFPKRCSLSLDHWQSEQVYNSLKNKSADEKQSRIKLSRLTYSKQWH